MVCLKNLEEPVSCSFQLTATLFLVLTPTMASCSTPMELLQFSAHRDTEPRPSLQLTPLIAGLPIGETIATNVSAVPASLVDSNGGTPNFTDRVVSPFSTQEARQAVANIATTGNLVVLNAVLEERAVMLAALLFVQGISCWRHVQCTSITCVGSDR